MSCALSSLEHYKKNINIVIHIYDMVEIASAAVVKMQYYKTDFITQLKFALSCTRI